MEDKEFAFVVYRALMMICRYLEKKHGFGGNKMQEGEYNLFEKKNQS